MKKIRILLCGLGIACVLSGCGRTVELTAEENAIITEYAVNLLLKYDKYYNNHLVELAEEEAETLDPAPEEEQAAEEETPDMETVEEPEIVETPVVDATEEPAISSIEEFYGIEGVTFRYDGYELCDEYPTLSEDSTELAFVMDASDGMQLLVLKFQAVSQNGANTELDMMNYNGKMRVSVNGEASQNVLSTMLLNDIQTFRGTIGAGEGESLAAIIEVPSGTSVNNLSLTLRNDSGSATLNLQ